MLFESPKKNDDCEEALLLAILLGVGLVIIVTMGAIIAPLLTGIVFAFVLQGVIKFLTRRHVAGWLAVTLAYLLFLGVMVALPWCFWASFIFGCGP